MAPSSFVKAALLLATASGAPVRSPDTSLATFPTVYYGANWHRDDDNIKALTNFDIIILMQEDGDCWATCCPNATSAPSQCGAFHNATAIPGCGPECDQHGKQNHVFERVKAKSREGEEPHCMLYLNAVYDFPFSKTHGLGNAIDVLDVNGNPHMETCDPGIYPSFFFDFGRTAAQQAWIDIVKTTVIDGSADGVYVDCYSKIPFIDCPPPLENGSYPSGEFCRAKRNGKVKSINEKVTTDQVNAYVMGKAQTLQGAFGMVRDAGGSFYSKNQPIKKAPDNGGNLVFIKDVDAFEPPGLSESIQTAMQFYTYVIVGAANDYVNPKLPHNLSEPMCDETQQARFLLAAEAGTFLLCNGYDAPRFDLPLGKPTGPATYDASTNTWSRSFEHGTTAKFDNKTKVGTVLWTKKVSA